MLYVFAVLMIVGCLVGFVASAAGMLGVIPSLESAVITLSSLSIGFVAACALDMIERRA